MNMYACSKRKPNCNCMDGWHKPRAFADVPISDNKWKANKFPTICCNVTNKVIEIIIIEDLEETQGMII